MRVVRGDRPPRPSLPNGDAISDVVWSLVQSCWDHDATRRLSADSVVSALEGGKMPLPIMIQQYLDGLRSAVQDRIEEIGKVCANVVLVTSDPLPDSDFV